MKIELDSVDLKDLIEAVQMLLELREKQYEESKQQKYYRILKEDAEKLLAKLLSAKDETA